MKARPRGRKLFQEHSQDAPMYGQPSHPRSQDAPMYGQPKGPRQKKVARSTKVRSSGGHLV